VFECENLQPGEGRVSFIEYVFVFFFKLRIRYERFHQVSKELGYWKVCNLSLYYAFMMVGDDLYGSKTFSIIKEDWVKLKFSEEIKTVILPSHQFTPKLQPGIDSPSAGPVTVRQTIQRIILPENGTIGSINEGVRAFYFI
jgi:hypothetical protein